jgi:predicted acylesterase/phospholipase RssA
MTSEMKQRPPFDCVALLLQGGGALGAYQAGVYETLADADIHPDWAAGISIGAINGASIAGNAPEARVDKLRVRGARRAYHDAVRTSRHPEVLERPTNREGVFIFDFPPRRPR